MKNLHDMRRRKTLIFLAAITLAVWAILTLSHLTTDGPRQTHARMGAPVLENFVETRAGAQRIRFTLADERYTLYRTAAGWVLEETGGYPIRLDRLAELATGLENLRLDVRRTSDPDKHDRIGLGDPTTGGNGARVDVFGADGNQTHSIIIGRKNDTVYVRAPDAAQTYRASGDLPAFYNRRAWLDFDIVQIDPSAIRSVRIMDVDGQPLYLRRVEGSDARSFRPAPPHQNDRLVSRLAASTTALAITRLSPVDVKPASDLTTQPVARHISETFDGLEIDLRAYREPFGVFVTLRAIEAGEGARRAQAINARADGWAFRLTEYDFQDFTPQVANIVERTN